MLVIKPGDQVILFDGICKVCNFWSRFILRIDKQKRFKLCSVQSPQGQQILANYGFPLDKFETMLLVRHDSYLTHSDAILTILQNLQFPWNLLSVLRWVPVSLRNACYSKIARHRYRLFGKYERCKVPPEGYKERFLDE